MSDQVRVVHAADIHLDSPLLGLGRLNDEDRIEDLRTATRRAFDNLIRYCVETVPDALVIAGDLYDGDWKDYSTGAYFVERMRDLKDAGVAVAIVQGNHDAESAITRSLTLPDNVFLLSTSAPQTVELGNLAIHGQGFNKPAVMENLAVAYPPPLPGLINIGLLHSSVDGYEGHDPYAPCTLSDLIGRNYDYFALGHVHKRQTLDSGRNAVAFSGNLQGRHPRETGAKGALEVLLTPDEAPVINFREFDVARWATLDIDVAEASEFSEAQSRLEAGLELECQKAGGRPLVARVTFSGTSDLAARFANREELGHEMRPLAARHGVIIDKITSSVQAPRETRRLPQDQRSLLEVAVREVEMEGSAIRHDPELKSDVQKLISEVNSRFTKAAGLDLESPQTLERLIKEAAQAVLAKADRGFE